MAIDIACKTNAEHALVSEFGAFVKFSPDGEHSIERPYDDVEKGSQEF